MSNFPGTIRRFAPSIFLTVAGGTTPSGINSQWNTWCEPYYQDWLDSSEGTKMGVYQSAVALKRFYAGDASLRPSDGTNPNDPAYDWSTFDGYLASQPIAQGKAKFHFMIDVEGSTIPAWMDNAGLVHKPPGEKEVINYTNSTLVSEYKDFWTAFAARYNDDIRVYTLFVDEDQSYGGVDENDWQAGKIEVYKHMSNALTKMCVIVTNNNVIIRELCNATDAFIGPGIHDPKLFNFETGSDGNYPPPGGYDSTSNVNRAIQEHNPVLASPPRAARPTFVGAFSNGFRIVGGSNGWDPPDLTNPWGELLPTSSEPPANPDTNITPSIYVWYISYEPRAASDDSGLGQSGTDPAGILPSSFVSINNSGIRLENITPQDWDLAFNRFGAPGTKAVPAIPYDFDQSASATTTASSTTGWVPSIGDSFFIQLDTDAGLDTTVNVDIYDIDIEDTSTANVALLQSQGKKVIGYFSAGSYEDWRLDEASFPESVKGNSVGSWPGERWLDIREIATLRTIMGARMDAAVAKGFDGVDPDNVDGYSNNTGFPLSAGHQITYNQMLASEAHNRGLAVALKNSAELVVDLVDDFDFSVCEQCFEYNEETMYSPYITAGKPVFNIEYLQKECTAAQALSFYQVLKTLDLDATRDPCNLTIDPPGTGEPISIDGVSTSGLSATTTTVNHNVSAGTDRLVVVGVAVEVADPVVSATINGIQMTSVADVTTPEGSHCEIFQALESDIQDGNNQVIVTSNDQITGTHITVASFSNVNQTIPTDTASSQAAAATSLTHPITTIDGGMHFDLGQHERFPRTMTMPTGQTLLTNISLQGLTSVAGYEIHSTGATDDETIACSGSADRMVFVSAAWNPAEPADTNIAIQPGDIVIDGSLFTSIGDQGASPVATIRTGSTAISGNEFVAGADKEVSMAVGSVQVSGTIPTVRESIPGGNYDINMYLGYANIVGKVPVVDSYGAWTRKADATHDAWIKLDDD